MVATAPPSERLHDVLLRQGQIKHAVKTALACCTAAGLSYWFRLPSGEFAPLFAFLLLTLGMPSPRINWLLALGAIVLSSLMSALILVAFGSAPLLYLAVTLVWIFTALLFTNWVSLPANLGAMVSAIGIFVFFHGTVGATFAFYRAYGLNWVVGGLAVVVIDTLLWPLTTQAVFLTRLGDVYASLEEDCLELARRIRSGEPPPVEASGAEWAPFRPLRQALAPELRLAQDSSNPFARMILAARALNLRLWFFRSGLAQAMLAACPSEERRQLASQLDQCAEQLHTLLECVWLGKQGPPFESSGRARRSDERSQEASASSALVAPGIPESILRRLAEDLRVVTTSHNELLARLRGGMAGELAALSPVTTGTRLLNRNSLRAATKLVILLLLLLVEEGALGLPGGTQVAFFAVFFASTGNLGRQNKADLVGLAGILAGLAYGVLAAFLTSRFPAFLLLLVLVFGGQFLANLVYQQLPRYAVAGLQAGLAVPFAYLATPGPEWGSFGAVRMRFAGLAVAGCTAVVVHAYLWPVLPMRHLRALIAASLLDTAASLSQLFAGPPRSRWEGSPPSLAETVTRARDLLDDARYLPGPEHADSAYLDVLRCLQEIDAYLEYVRFVLSLEPEHALRERFFEVVGDYAVQAQGKLERVAQQFQQSPGRAALLEPVHWEPDALGLWERNFPTSGTVPESAIDPTRPGLIARSLDQIASATERASSIAQEINLRNRDFGRL